jgi:hypothetical protein
VQWGKKAIGVFTRQDRSESVFCYITSDYVTYYLFLVYLYIP